MLPDTGDKKVTKAVIAIVHFLCPSERILNGVGVLLTSSLAPMVMGESPCGEGRFSFKPRAQTFLHLMPIHSNQTCGCPGNT